MSVVKGPDRRAGLNRAIEMLGGIGRFVKKGETVLIKPNAGFATPPDLGATTHPDLVSAMVSLCFKGGAKRVIVTDNPINESAGCFLLSGIERAAVSAGAEIMLPKSSFFHSISLKGGSLIRDWPVLFEPMKTADKLIGISPVKSHQRSGASMAMKNWYGLLGGRRSIFHQNINAIIAELAALVKPTLVILDAVQVMMTNGPTGGSLSDLVRRNTLIASCDQVAADSYGCELLNLTKSELPYIAKAERAGAGSADYRILGILTDERRSGR